VGKDGETGKVDHHEQYSRESVLLPAQLSSGSVQAVLVYDSNGEGVELRQRLLAGCCRQRGGGGSGGAGGVTRQCGAQPTQTGFALRQPMLCVLTRFWFQDVNCHIWSPCLGSAQLIQDIRVGQHKRWIRQGIG
jgi:hypothetical protein